MVLRSLYCREYCLFVLAYFVHSATVKGSVTVSKYWQLSVYTVVHRLFLPRDGVVSTFPFIISFMEFFAVSIVLGCKSTDGLSEGVLCIVARNFAAYAESCRIGVLVVVQQGVAGSTLGGLMTATIVSCVLEASGR
jgi:hypothetical protein